MNKDEQVAVEQIDRDAAARVCDLTGWKRVAVVLRQGGKFHNDSPEEQVVQAFARHRTRALSGDEEALGEALFNLSARLKDAGFLDDDANHAAYKAVVTAFAALTTPSQPQEAVAWMYTHWAHPKDRPPAALCFQRKERIGEGWTETPLYAATPPQAAESGLLEAVSRFLSDYDDGDRAEAGNSPLMEAHVCDFRALLAKAGKPGEAGNG